MPRPYSLQKRESAYYVQFWNPTTNRYTTARSTRTKDRDKALLLAEDWLRNGIPQNTKPKKLNHLPSEAKKTLNHSFPS